MVWETDAMFRKKPNTTDGSSGEALAADADAASGDAAQDRATLPYDRIDRLLAGLAVIGLACMTAWVLLRFMRIGWW